jgi:hypothetical protein
VRYGNKIGIRDHGRPVVPHPVGDRRRRAAISSGCRWVPRSGCRARRIGPALTPGALVSVRVAAETGALVLLGEPGIGKTTEFNGLGGSLDHSPTGSLLRRVIDVNAGDLTDGTYDELLGRHLRTLPEHRGSNQYGEAYTVEGGRGGTREAATTLTVIIDQIDESPLIRHLAARLRISLQERETSRLRLVLGCRTADYPSDLTDALTSIFGECNLADLAPLTRLEAVRLAGSADDADGESLIAAAVEAGAAALANVPLTLGLLVRTYRQTGTLNARPTELFALGVLQLLDEPDEGRQVVDDVSSVQQRMAVAGRLAARLLLSGRRLIWRGTVLESGEHDLNADSLVGGQETCPSGPFPVTKKLVLATLATGLFTGRGTNRLAFRHGSFAAYLTARYLVDRGVSKEQLERMFWWRVATTVAACQRSFGRRPQACHYPSRPRCPGGRCVRRLHRPVEAVVERRLRRVRLHRADHADRCGRARAGDTLRRRVRR